MNKLPITVALLIAGVGTANAQSAVNITGLLDIGVKHFSNPAPGTPKNSVGRGNNNRITFSGTEDLGGGLSATFGLQHRFEPDTGTLESPANGTSRPFWQGESRVGLRSTQLGWIRLGRGLTAIQDPNGAYDVYGVATVASLQGVLTAGFNSDPAQSNGAGGGRINNGIFYQTPSLAGMVVRASFAPTEGAPGYQYKHVGVSGEYLSGPLAAMAGWERNSAGNTLVEIAGKYDFGPAVGFLGVSHQGVRNSSSDRTGIAVGARVPVNTFVVKLGYGRLKTNDFVGSAAATDTVLGAGVDYLLSKRTYLYADIARLKTAVGLTAVDYRSTTAADLGIALTF
jgi:predicted porin